MTQPTPYAETHTVTLVKQAQRALRDKVIDNNLTSLVASVNNKSLMVRGWTLDRLPQADSPEGNAWSKDTEYDADGSPQYTYRMYLALHFSREDGKAPDTYETASIVKTLAKRATQPQFGRWTLEATDDKPYEATDDDEISDDVNRDLIGYSDVDIPDGEEWDEHFSHLFGLDAHITRVRSALMAGANSHWRNRFHSALIGPPGCGKSDICESVKRALGDDAVMKLDATATTAAGAIKELSEREILPRVIVIEEIEKAPEAAMTFLLGVLDQRSEIRKTTARGTIQRDTKLYAIATVNDVALFRKLQAGALASRFPNTIFFSRPSRETLALILAREVSKVDGNPDWITPALDYCEDHRISDPRKVIAICLCGGDALLDGSYQAMMTETSEDSAEDD